MTDFTLQELIPVIQTAIGPVILISDVGLLLIGVLIVVIFILCIASLVAALVMFLVELQTSLNALEIELKQAAS